MTKPTACRRAACCCGVAHRHHAPRSSRAEGAAAGELVLEMPSIVSGPAERVAEELQAQRARYRISYLLVADGDMDAFVPVVDRLAGR